MAGLKERLKTYKSLVESLRNLEVVDHFYADHIQHQENDESPIMGKQVCRRLEEQNLHGVKLLEQKITSLYINEEDETVMGEMYIRFKSEKHGVKTLNEAFKQQWKEGKIVYQKFYYHGFKEG